MSERYVDPRVDRDAASREATRIQRRGADPRRHAVLRASAGSGKTKVLIDRLVRLLLDGAPLKSLAAMTFTRKAAVEIRDRLLDRVRTMARDDDDALRERLRTLLQTEPDEARIRRARSLFEEVLEDPSGVHIGTIHTFCQSLLARFADLAGIDPAFGILERTDELWDEALDRLERTVADDDADRADYAAIASTPAAARADLGAWRHHRLELDRWCDEVAKRTDAPPDGPRSRLLPALERDLSRAIFTGTSLAEVAEPTAADLREPVLTAVADYLADGIQGVREAQEPHGTDAFERALTKRAEKLQALAEELEADGDPRRALDALRAEVFTGTGTVKVGNAGGAKNKEERNAAFAEAAVPVARAIALGDLLELLTVNRLRLRFGLRALDLYDELKRRDRVLDFHDLERLAWRLVRHEELGPWVQYRLDERLDHLLVDEFQDTNRNQWGIVAPFVDEFLAALDDRERPRTVFLVGDVKQSIYRFRGACPEIFGEAADAMAAAVEDDPRLTLPTNFRSLPDVVFGVGERFGRPPLCDHLPGPDEVAAAEQRPFRDTGPGRIVFRPVIADEDDVDAQTLCARRLARQIQTFVAEGEVWDEDADAHRRARYDDVLVLCRARTRMGAFEQALREAGIPFEPAGRGALGRSREVRDMAALLRWLVHPADDAALASVLRSPLVRLDEATVQGLLTRAVKRGDLWTVLEASTDLEPAVSLLRSWLDRAGRDGAHDLLRRIYRDADVPARYAAALGEQARQNLLRLHDLALSHDAGAFASLRGFLRELDRAAVTSDHEEGALPESDGGRVRVMTIHKSKGLESPFVVLVDAANPFRENPDLVQLGGDHGPLVGGLRKEHRRPPAGLAATTVSTAAAAEIEASRREEANLLYVAMTRARDEFHVMTAEPSRGGDGPSHANWLAETELPITPWPEDEPATDPASSPASRAAVDADAPTTWTPVDVGPLLSIATPSAGADDHAPEVRLRAADAADGPAAADRGTRIHLWLQRAAESGAMPPGAGEEWEEARTVFENPAHDHVFRPAAGVTAHCEVPILHRVAGEGLETRVQGVIDRLLIADDRITVVDYKSNRVDPADADALAAHYAPQMNAYRDALAAAYPGRPVDAVLLFTHLEGADGPGLVVTIRA